MPTIADLFKDKEKDLYENEIVRIESRGLVNPPRAAALLASSMDTIGDVIGGQLAGAIGGTANRPSDTIFKGNSFIDKPVSLLGVTEGLLKSSVEAGTDYYIKQAPSPIPPLFGKSAPGGSTTAGTIANQAIKQINKLGSKKAVKNLVQELKSSTQSTYGPTYAIGADGKPLKEKILNSEYKETYSQITNPNTYAKEHVAQKLVKRESGDNWDEANHFIQTTTGFASLEEYNTKKSTLQEEALAKNIVLVCPSTLMATLRTVAHLWRQDHQNRNALEIAKQCGNLYDKFVGFVDDLEKLGQRLDQAQTSYHDAFNKLKTGKGNLIRSAEKVRELGVKPSKNLAPPLIESSSDFE